MMTMAEKQDDQQLERAIAAIDWTDSPVQLTRHVRRRKVTYTVNGAEPYLLSRLTEAQMVQVYRTLKTWCEINPGLECGSHVRSQAPCIWCPRVFRDEVRFCARAQCAECGGYYSGHDSTWGGAGASSEGTDGPVHIAALVGAVRAPEPDAAPV